MQVFYFFIAIIVRSCLVFAIIHDILCVCACVCVFRVWVVCVVCCVVCVCCVYIVCMYV